MSSGQILRDALAHREGRVPVDFGATPVSGMHCSVVEKLRACYGLEGRPVRIIEPYQMLGEIDDELMDAMGVDVVGVNPRNTMFGFPMEGWKEWMTPWGQIVEVPGSFNTVTRDGSVYIFPGGDTEVPPSGCMPESGFFFDSVSRQPPLDEDRLDPQDNLEEFTAISDDDLAYFARACRAAERTGRGVVANFGGTALGDVALVPAPGMKYPKGIRDVTEWYVSTVARQDYLHEVFSGQVDIALANLERIYGAVGDIPDAVYICGTDFGTQTSQFCSAETFVSLYAPYYRRINDWIHAHTGWKSFKHSCGAIFPLLPHLIEAGFDIINPVQCSAAGMDPRQLKRSFGDDIVFWGGGVDTQSVLPFGTPEEVREQVRFQIETLAPGGGFIFNAVHNIQANTPVENVTAMLEVIAGYNG